MVDRRFICPCYRHKADIAENGHCICHLFVDDDYEPTIVADPPQRWEGCPWPEIVVYGAYWCGDTVRVRLFLNRHGIPYRVVDVDHDLDAREQVRMWNGGHVSTPTLDVAGQIVTEPSDEELAALLGIDP